MAAREPGIGGHQSEKDELMDQALDIFAPIQEETQLISGYEVEYSPIAPLAGNNPIEFVVPSEGVDKYIQLNATTLRGYYQVLRGDGTSLANTDDDVALVNNAPHSMFKNVKIKINNMQINAHTDTYAYRAYMENMLSFSSKAKGTYLAATTQWYEDSLSNYNVRKRPTTSDGEGQAVLNHGWEKRHELCKNSKRIYFEIPVIADLFQCNRMLMGGYDLRVEFIRAPEAFTIMCAANAEYMIHLGDVRLAMRRVEVAQSLVASHQKLHASRPIILPLLQVKMHTYLIQQGARNSHTTLFNGVLPSHINLAIAKNSAVAGKNNENPFSFKPYSVNEILLRVNGSQVPNSRAYRPDFNIANCVREYSALHGSVGASRISTDIDLTLDGYRSDNCMYGFDLTPDMCNGFHVHRGQKGTMTLDIGFETPTIEVLSIIVYASFQSVLTIGLGQHELALVEI